MSKKYSPDLWDLDHLLDSTVYEEQARRQWPPAERLCFQTVGRFPLQTRGTERCLQRPRAESGNNIASALRPATEISMNSELEKVLQFVRLDGTPRAPVCFLTIEDGDGWGDHPTAEALNTFFNTQPAREIPKNTLDTGKPGVMISKLMLALFSEELEAIVDWRAYRKDVLYRRNECNVKFYPVGRPNTRYWHGAIRDLLGTEESQYLTECRERRPGIIRKTYPEVFDGSQTHIILAARNEWQSVLHASHGTRPVESTTGHSAGWQLFTRGSSMAYAYFNIFRHGVSTADIRSFCDAVRPLIPESVRTRISP